MSRHEFTDEAGNEWTVGYDEQLVTFFAQYYDADPALDDPLVDVAGDRLGDVTTVASLINRLEGATEIPADIVAKLEREAPPFTAAAKARATARLDQLAAHLRDGLNGATRRGPDVER